MTKLNDIYRDAEQYGIQVECFRMPISRSMSMMDDQGHCFIGIDPFALTSTADEKVKLTHELGHCLTGAFYNRYSSYNCIARQEARADRWAVKRLISIEDLYCAFHMDLTQIWELAEYFDVTESFIQKTIDVYTYEGLYDVPVCED